MNTKIVFVIFWCILSLGCKDYERFSQKQAPTHLINGIESYQSVNEFLRLVESKYRTENITEQRGFEGDRYRPPFKEEILVIREYSHLDEDGELIVTFFNDSLKDTIFFPENYSVYLEKLSVAIGKELGMDQRVSLTSNTILRTSEDYRGRPYVAWKDKRLEELMLEWIRKYA